MAAPNRMHSVEENSLIEIIASTNIDAGRKLEQQRQVDGLYSVGRFVNLYLVAD